MQRCLVTTYPDDEDPTGRPIKVQTALAAAGASNSSAKSEVLDTEKDTSGLGVLTRVNFEGIKIR